MKLKRIQKIERYIYQSGSVSLDELCETFNVSKNTIRRDINYLEENGGLKKVYGGVIANKTSLIPFENRTVQNQEKKQCIAHVAATIIEENDLVFIDSGTTTRQMLEVMDNNKNFTVLTNSLDIINAVASLNKIQLVIVGHTYKRDTQSFVGIDEDDTINRYNINKAFMSATGVSIKHGLTNSDILETEIKKHVAKRSGELYLLADSSKFGKSTLLTYAELTDVKCIITNEHLSTEYVDYCLEHNIKIQYSE